MNLEAFLAHLFTMQPAQAQYYGGPKGVQWHQDNVRDHMARLAADPAPGSDTPQPTTMQVWRVSYNG